MIRHLRFLPLCLAASAALAADARLQEALQKIARYEYDQGRESLLAFENAARSVPAREVETELISFLASSASLAGKDFAMRQLSVVGSDASVPALAAALARNETREMARFALERIGSEAALDALRKALAKAPEEAKTGIVNSLGSRRDAKAVVLLQPLATSTDRVLAEAAIAAMGRIASPQALSALAVLRKNESIPAMEASLLAAERLLASGDSAAAEKIYLELNNPALPVMVRLGALRGLANGKHGVSILAAAVHDRNPKIQAAALQSLGEVKDEAATAVLASEYAKLPAEARPYAVTALARRADRASLPVLVRASGDDSVTVRVAAYHGLSQLADPSAVMLLAKAAADPNNGDAAREAARGELDRMRGRAIDAAIVAGIANAGTAEKIELIRSAGERGIRDASPVLLALLKGAERPVRREVFKALRETAGENEVKPLLALLNDSPSAADRRDLERALSTALRRGGARGQNDVAAAFQSAQQAALKESLLQVMGQTGGAAMLPLLRESLRDANPELIRAAILGLSDWPSDAPIADLLPIASTGADEANRILAQRGVLKLLGGSTRPAAEAVPILEAILKAAKMADEKKAVLAMLPRYPTKPALALARSLEGDPDTAAEAKAAAARLMRVVPQQ